MKRMAESDLLCYFCNDGSSDEPNEIVICDVCNRGYHQRCHKPKIPASILAPSASWSCRFCEFALGSGGFAAGKVLAGSSKRKPSKTCFPYDPSLLKWDDNHLKNKQNLYCYCGGPGEFDKKMLQCQACEQWFHEGCIDCLETPLLYGDHYYQFGCGVCNKGKEQIKRIIMKWSDVVALALHNLKLQQGKRFFNLTTDIVRFVRENSQMFKLSTDIDKFAPKDLAKTIDSVLNNNVTRFVSGKEAKHTVGYWGLRPSCGPVVFAPPNTVLGRTSSVSNLSITPTKSEPLAGACRKTAAVVPLKAPTQKRLPPPKLKSKSIQKASLKVAQIAKKAEKLIKTAQVSKKVPTKLVKAKAPKEKTKCSKPPPTPAIKQKAKPAAKPAPIRQPKPRFIQKKNKNKKPIDDEINDLTLDMLIPVPPNFHGENNPFFDLDDSTNTKKESPFQPEKEKSLIHIKTEVEDGFAVKPDPISPFRLTIQRITGSKMAPRRLEAEIKKDFNIVPAHTPVWQAVTKYNVLARRVDHDGKVEYCLEWEHPTNN